MQTQSCVHASWKQDVEFKSHEKIRLVCKCGKVRYKRIKETIHHFGGLGRR